MTKDGATVLGGKDILAGASGELQIKGGRDVVVKGSTIEQN